jgi:steroid delta-isomerase-like uncharacterized protein
MSDQNKELVRRLMEDDISKADPAVADAIIAPDFFDHTNPPGMQHGIEGHKAIVRLFHDAFPDMFWKIEDMIAEGDRVVTRTTMTATHLGDFFGIPPTGKHVTLTGVHVLRIADGRIAEHWGNNDDLGLMQQLGFGLSPPAETAAPA